MSRIRGSDTKPELRLRRLLWAEGYRYRVGRRIGRVRPDLVFVGPRVAVFVDGCFWHGCPEHYVMPRSRREFWSGKLMENIERDRRQTQLLANEGWTVVRMWEHEVHTVPRTVVDRVGRAVKHGEPAVDREVVVRVEPRSDDRGIEDRYLEEFGDPESARVVTGPRVTAKWKVPSEPVKARNDGTDGEAEW